MILIIDCGSSKTPNFVKKLSVEKEKIKTIKIFDDFPASDFSHIIISGAPILLNEVDIKVYLDYFNFLLKEDFKKINVLGVCFGHQVLGLLHGAKISFSEERRKAEAIQIKNQHFLFEGIATNHFMIADHIEQINLPENFNLIASSEFIKNEGMSHQSLPHFGVQFHPEVSGKVGEILLNNFINKI